MFTFLFFGALFTLLSLSSASRAMQMRRLREATPVRAQLGEGVPAVHEYAEVDARGLGHLDLEFYQRAETALAQLGFRKVADIEDLTLSRMFPELRTFVRTMVDEGGFIRAGIHHVRRGGLSSLAFGFGPRSVHLIELVTEAPQGRFLITTTSRGLHHLPSPPEIESERMSPDGGVTALVERHRERVAALLGKRNPSPVVVTRFDALVASVQRVNAAIARFRSGQLARAAGGAGDLPT